MVIILIYILTLTQHCDFNSICETESQTFDILKVKLSINMRLCVLYLIIYLPTAREYVVNEDKW